MASPTRVGLSPLPCVLSPHTWVRSLRCRCCGVYVVAFLHGTPVSAVKPRYDQFHLRGYSLSIHPSSNMYNRRRQAGDGTLQSKDEAASAATPCVHLSMAYSAKMPGSSATRASLKSAVQLSQSAPVLRRHNPRPRVSAAGIAPTRLALLVLSTLATAVSGVPTLFNGPCRSSGNCICSSNYYSDCSGLSGSYANNEVCLFYAYGTEQVTSSTLSTESCCDKLTMPRDAGAAINTGTQYFGSSAPSVGLTVPGGRYIDWKSDGSVTTTGWKVCFAGDLPPPPPPPSPCNPYVLPNGNAYASCQAAGYTPLTSAQCMSFRATMASPAGGSHSISTYPTGCWDG